MCIKPGDMVYYRQYPDEYANNVRRAVVTSAVPEGVIVSVEKSREFYILVKSSQILAVEPKKRWYEFWK